MMLLKGCCTPDGHRRKSVCPGVIKPTGTCEASREVVQHSVEGDEGPS